MREDGEYSVSENNIHLELNRPQPWSIRLGSALICRIVWPFIK